MRGNTWTPDEQSAIQNAITPAPGEGFLRNFGKLDPPAHGGGGAHVPLTGLVGAGTGPPGIASAGARIGGAMAARRLPEAMVKNSVNRARQIMLNIAGDRET